MKRLLLYSVLFCCFFSSELFASEQDQTKETSFSTPRSSPTPEDSDAMPDASPPAYTPADISGNQTNSVLAPPEQPQPHSAVNSQEQNDDDLPSYQASQAGAVLRLAFGRGNNTITEQPHREGCCLMPRPYVRGEEPPGVCQRLCPVSSKMQLECTVMSLWCCCPCYPLALARKTMKKGTRPSMSDFSLSGNTSQSADLATLRRQAQESSLSTLTTQPTATPDNTTIPSVISDNADERISAMLTALDETRRNLDSFERNDDEQLAAMLATLNARRNNPHAFENDDDDDDNTEFSKGECCCKCVCWPCCCSICTVYFSLSTLVCSGCFAYESAYAAIAYPLNQARGTLDQ